MIFLQNCHNLSSNRGTTYKTCILDHMLERPESVALGDTSNADVDPHSICFTNVADSEIGTNVYGSSGVDFRIFQMFIGFH